MQRAIIIKRKAFVKSIRFIQMTPFGEGRHSEPGQCISGWPIVGIAYWITVTLHPAFTVQTSHRHFSLLFRLFNESEKTDLPGD